MDGVAGVVERAAALSRLLPALQSQGASLAAQTALRVQSSEMQMWIVEDMDAMNERGYSEEQWKAACENAGIGPCVQCWTRPHYRHDGHIEHLPDVGDPAAVLAMLEFYATHCSADDWDLLQIRMIREVDRLSPTIAVVLACAALRKEG